MKKILKWGLIVFVVIALLGTLVGGDDSSKENSNDEIANQTIENNNENTSEDVEDETEKESVVDKVKSNFIYDGVYKVGTDIEPGLYKVDVTDELMNVGYIDRASDASMDFDSIIANVIIQNSGYVRIKDTDAYVKVQGAALSGEETIKKDIKEEIESGVYLIGVDISPGTYKVIVTDEASGMGYVERLSDVTMVMDDIIANQVFENQGYVDILESDYAVRIQGATLTKSE